MNWIKCSDQMPEKDIPVLIFYAHTYIDVAEYWHDDGQGKPVFFNPPSPPTNNVTHWMPLPKKPND